MFETPSPTHGYFRVVVAFWVYITLATVVALGAREFGVSAGGTVLVFLLTALLLLKPFLPVFRRLLPAPSREK
ncbi:hypothetical protein HUG10_09225 [Halorarum halophilum]|uniref:Uncharacterized protein n=1 Tax=Halorarum halophilum TaxID=2743090 RepID=A0A7D5KMH1_9EURY|nr:hypothetical protein [Halobaculum halophilum]QLG27722.1 hypothetical protein HUG10_09225 [Halobaculum halophilum]